MFQGTIIKEVKKLERKQLKQFDPAKREQSKNQISNRYTYTNLEHEGTKTKNDGETVITTELQEVRRFEILVRYEPLSRITLTGSVERRFFYQWLCLGGLIKGTVTTKVL